MELNFINNQIKNLDIFRFKILLIYLFKMHLNSSKFIDQFQIIRSVGVFVRSELLIMKIILIFSLKKNPRLI